MTEKDNNHSSLSRREFLEGTGLTTLALSTGALAGVASLSASDTQAKSAAGSPGKPYNILFILTDQERYFDPASLPVGYSLPGRERLQREGTTFANNQIGTSVCSSSRSVIYTGQHIQHTKVFDNLGFPWSNELSLDTPYYWCLPSGGGVLPSLSG